MKAATLLRPSILAVSIVALSLATVSARAAQTLLNPGDLVILEAEAATTDQFSFAPLVNIGAGTAIFFTENGRNGTNASNWTDWTLTPTGQTGAFNETWNFLYVAPADIAAGTRITLTPNAGSGFSTNGDNLFAYQGTPQQPTFLGLVGYGSTIPVIISGTATTNNTYAPSGLSASGQQVIIANTSDNAVYAGITSGTKAALFAAVNNATNWTSSNSATTAVSSLVVSGAASGTLATSQLSGYSFGVTAAAYTTAADIAAGSTTLSSFGARQGGPFTFDSDGGNGAVAQSIQAESGLQTGTSLNLATTDALGFTMTIDAGMAYDLERIEFATSRSSDGPTSLALYVSTDGFANSTQLGSTLTLGLTPTNQVWNITDAAVNGFSGTVEFRFYFWGATASTGDFEMDEVWAVGNVTPVPEPSALGSLIFGVASLAGWRRFRRLARS